MALSDALTSDTDQCSTVTDTEFERELQTGIYANAAPDNQAGAEPLQRNHGSSGISTSC